MGEGRPARLTSKATDGGACPLPRADPSRLLLSSSLRACFARARIRRDVRRSHKNSLITRQSPRRRSSSAAFGVIVAAFFLEPQTIRDVIIVCSSVPDRFPKECGSYATFCLNNFLPRFVTLLVAASPNRTLLAYQPKEMRKVEPYLAISRTPFKHTVRD